MFRKQHPQAGSRPGTLMISDDAVPTRIRVTRYSPAGIREETIGPAHDFTQGIDDTCVTWIDIQGFGNVELLRSIAEQFQVHPLALESVINVPHRPKAERFGDQLLLITRVATFKEEVLDLGFSQLSIFLGPRYVVTVQDSYSETLEPIRQRLENHEGQIRQMDADYLAYTILDTAVDGYYPVLELIGEQFEELENRVIEDPHPGLLSQVNHLRNLLANMRRTIWPQRDAIGSLVMGENELIHPEVRTYLRNTHDHCVQTSDVVEMYRDMGTGLMNTYLSSVAHRTNEVMKVLTIMSSIFVPLTFLAGIYGMNFEFMPELSYRWAYPAVWMTMLATAGGMLWFLWRKGWIVMSSLHGSESDRREIKPLQSSQSPSTNLAGHAVDFTKPPVDDGKLRLAAPLRKAG